MIGWIKLHRKLINNPIWFSEKFTRGQAWVDMILLANHEDSFFYKRGVKIDVKRGQLGRSEVELSDRWKWSRTKVRKFLSELEKEQQIIQHKTNVTQLVTIINYDNYQQKEQQTRQQTRQQKNTYKNDKEEKEKSTRKKFVAPTIKMIKDYTTENGYNIDAEKVFNYYDVSNWIDSKGNKVRNWKQKILSVWCKPENKINKESIEDQYLSHYKENENNTISNKYAFLLKQKKDILYTFNNILTIDEFSKLKINGNLETVIISFQNYGKTKDEFLTNLGIHVRKY